MINTKVALLCFVLILICSTFFANIAQQIDFDIHQTASSKFDINSNSKKYENLSIIGESSDQLMWFIQACLFTIITNEIFTYPVTLSCAMLFIKNLPSKEAQTLYSD